MRSAFGCALLGLLLLLVAGTFDAEPLYVTGIALLLLGAGAAAWVGLAAQGASLERTLGGRTVLEGEALRLVLSAQAGRLPFPSGWIDEPLLEEPLRLVAGQRAERARVEVTFTRRGHRMLLPAVLVVRDPFGLAERVVGGGERDEVLVLPRTYPVRAAGGGGQRGAARGTAMLTAAAENEIDGLRPHVEGSPASRIHWPSLARGAGLMERRLVAEADSRPLVVLDPRGPDPDALDAAVRAAGSLVLHFAGQRGCGLLLPGDRRAHEVGPDQLGWPALHARLAVLDGEAGGPALSAAQSRRGLIVYVAARPVDRVPQAVGRTPGGSLLVVPGALPGRSALFEVAGCQGYVGARTGAAKAVAAV